MMNPDDMPIEVRELLASMDIGSNSNDPQSFRIIKSIRHYQGHNNVTESYQPMAYGYAVDPQCSFPTLETATEYITFRYPNSPITEVIEHHYWADQVPDLIASFIDAFARNIPYEDIVKFVHGDDQ